MHVTVIGSGDVGKALAFGFAKKGNYTTIVTRNPNNASLHDWNDSHDFDINIIDYGDIDKDTEVFVIAVQWAGVFEAIDRASKDIFRGKIIIDATNPVKFDADVPGLLVSYPESAGKKIQEYLPDAHVVKAFNIIGHQHMYMPQFETGTPDMIICGNDTVSKTTVTNILHGFGWESVLDFGLIENAYILETLCNAWVRYYSITKSSNHAISFVTE
jgi:hypothetical protein